MNSEKEAFSSDCVDEGPRNAMERMLLEEYLQQKGFTLARINELPQEEARDLMAAACQYASLRLAYIESTSHFRESIRGPQ